jgi:branched-chain amino acid transport system permease protein
VQQLVQQLYNGVYLGSIYALIALGYTMVYGVLRLINFAHGDVYMLGAFVGWYAAQRVQPPSGGSIPLAIGGLVLCMAACAVAGLIIERLAYRPLRSAPRLTALITAIGVSLFLENAVQLLAGPDPKFYPEGLVPSATVAQTEILTVKTDELMITVVALLLMAGLGYIVTKTRVGRAMRAVSYDRVAASLMGINTNTIIAFTFALGSALAGAAGLLYPMLSRTRVDPLMGIMPGLKAFVAAVLGGIGSIPGAMAGGLIMGIAEQAVVGFGYSTYRDAIAFVILILILLFRPAGLFGHAVVEKV